MDRIKIASFFDNISAWSLYMMIFALPFAKSLIEIMIVVALISIVIKKFAAGEKLFTLDPVTIFLLLYIVLTPLSFINSAYLSLSIRAFFSKSLKFAALLLVTREVLNTRDKTDRFFVSLTFSAILILIDAFIQYYVTHIDFLHSYPSFKYRAGVPGASFPTASFPFPNDFAAWILMLIFPFGMYAFFGKGAVKRSAASLFIFAGLLWFLILTKTRGAWLGFLTAITFLVFSEMKKVVIIFLVVLLLGTIIVHKDRMSDIFSFLSIQDRMVMWKNGFEIFKKHPIIGNGLNTFFSEYTKVRTDEDRGKKGSYAHNCYLQMASDIGLVGLCAFLLFAGALVLKGFKALKKTKDPKYHSLILGVSLGLVAFLIHSIVDTNLYSLNLAALFWIFSGLLLALVDISKKETA